MICFCFQFLFSVSVFCFLFSVYVSVFYFLFSISIFCFYFLFSLSVSIFCLHFLSSVFVLLLFCVFYVCLCSVSIFFLFLFSFCLCFLFSVLRMEEELQKKKDIALLRPKEELHKKILICPAESWWFSIHAHNFLFDRMSLNSQWGFLFVIDGLGYVTLLCLFNGSSCNATVSLFM